MGTDLWNISLAFLEGFVLIISPCILPILPIVLAGSLTGSKKRPLGIIFGFIVIFTTFTFFSRTLLQSLGVDFELLRHIAYGFLLLLGLMMISEYLTNRFNQLTQGLASIGTRFAKINNPQGGFGSGMIFGGLIAIIWTPCAGPILATVMVQTIIQQTNYMSFLVLLAFTIGVAVPMAVITVWGRQIIQQFNFKNRLLLIRKLLGLVIILSVLYVIYLEFHGLALYTPPSQVSKSDGLHLEQGLIFPYPAPPIEGIEFWINSQPLQLHALRGQVVLIDFWTYSCINCLRTLPYLLDWYSKYHQRGFTIIGIHAPEFYFEKDVNNVKAAVQKYGISYPIALDNQFVTWRNYHNVYWPAHYLLDKAGNVVYTHFGEGDYDIMENNIQYLLKIKKPPSVIKEKPVPFTLDLTPEIYLGYARSENFVSPKGIMKNKVAYYNFPSEIPINQWALKGYFTILPDKIIAQSPGSLAIHFYARQVYMVAGSASAKTIKVKIVFKRDARTIFNKEISISAHELYEMINLPEPQEGVLQILITDPGLEMYTFTFG